MSFTPHSPLLVHQGAPGVEIAAWLVKAQGEPFVELRQTHPQEAFPEAGPASLGQSPLPNDPIDPVATCPETGRMLRLHVMRDHSCALLRAGPSGGPSWELLPIGLSMPSEIYDAALRTVPFDERHSRIARLRLQASCDGLRWLVINDPGHTVSARDIADLIARAMESMAARILAAPPVADPRVHSNIPGGARFAPYSAWPDVSDFTEEIWHIRAVLDTALSPLAGPDRESFQIRVNRITPPTPWNGKGRSSHISNARMSQECRGMLNRLLDHPQIIPDALRYGPADSVLIPDFRLDENMSNHRRLMAMQILSGVISGFSTRNTAPYTIAA